MHRLSGSMVVGTLVLALALAGGVGAQQQQHQQHHPGDAQTSQAQPAAPGTESSPPTQGMEGMQGMQGMMQGMQSMMQGMQSMMQGMMGRRGMMQEGDEEGGQRGGMMGQGGMIQRHLERLAQQLELTDDQRAQVRTLLSNHAKEAIRLRADIGVTAIDVRQLLEAEPVDLPKAKQLLQTISGKEVDLRLAHITLMQEISKVLTPEQRQKFRALRGSMMGSGGMMMGPGGMMGSGSMMGRGRSEQ